MDVFKQAKMCASKAEHDEGWMQIHEFEKKKKH